MTRIMATLLSVLIPPIANQEVSPGHVAIMVACCEPCTRTEFLRRTFYHEAIVFHPRLPHPDPGCLWERYHAGHTNTCANRAANTGANIDSSINPLSTNNGCRFAWSCHRRRCKCNTRVP